jgi:hypothetical protein
MPEVGHRTVRTIAEGGEGSPSNRGGDQGVPADRGGPDRGNTGNIGATGQISSQGSPSFEHRVGKDAPELKNMPTGDPRPTPAAATDGVYKSSNSHGSR